MGREKKEVQGSPVGQSEEVTWEGDHRRGYMNIVDAKGADEAKRRDDGEGVGPSSPENGNICK